MPEAFEKTPEVSSLQQIQEAQHNIHLQDIASAEPGDHQNFPPFQVHRKGSQQRLEVVLEDKLKIGGNSRS